MCSAACSTRRAKRANERADAAEKNRAYQRARAAGAEEARDLARLGVGRRDDEIAELKKLVRELEAELLRTK